MLNYMCNLPKHIRPKLCLRPIVTALSGVLYSFRHFVKGILHNRYWKERIGN
jgi:hypothetical protein